MEEFYILQDNEFFLNLSVLGQDSENFSGPIITSETKKWLEESGITKYKLKWVKVGYYLSFPKFDTVIIFKNKSDAVLYKLTWGGSNV